MSSGNEASRIYRGSLKTKPELIEFFKTLESLTAKGMEKTPYNTPNRYVYGAIDKVMTKFKATRPTVLSRIKDYPNGITESSKPKRADGTFEQWAQTDCFNAIKQHPDAFDARKKEFTKKGKKYEAHLKKVFELTKKDPLDLGLEEWLVFWGNPAKSQGTAHPAFTDGMTMRVSYSAAVSFRFAMRRSHAVDIQQLIITEDGRFNTETLKRPKGLHKDEFQSEDQIKALPAFIPDIETLMLNYMGILFGGRFDALKDITPADVKREFHLIHFFEGKVNRDVDKPIFEPETSFIWRYITDRRLTKAQKLFPHNITYYNAILTSAGKAMGKQYPELAFINDKDEEWTLTTHRGFKHTCVTQMQLHGVRRDVISDYVGTDEATLKDFYQGGADVNIMHEIGGLKTKIAEPTWREFVYAITAFFEKRYNELLALLGVKA
jgi:hypothetical protein